MFCSVSGSRFLGSALTHVVCSFAMPKPKPTRVPHPYGQWEWIELWEVDSDDEVGYGARPHRWAFEVDEHGDDMWVEWSLEEDAPFPEDEILHSPGLIVWESFEDPDLPSRDTETGKGVH